MVRLSLHVPGEHNVLNSLATCSVAFHLGIALDMLNEGLLHFTGADQRFEIKGTTTHGVTIIDDYAHHPTEIKATLKVAHQYPHRSFYVVFQPHTYTRTKAFLEQFAEALSDAEHIIVTDIYAAREKDPGDISSKDIVSKLEQLGKKALYLSSFEAISDYLKQHTVAGDVVLTMGAGNVNQIGDLLLK